MTRTLLLGVSLLTGCDQTATWAGDWTGTVAGHAQFSGTWERDPYCEGEIAGAVGTDGIFEWTGDCVVVWGSDEGDVLDVTVTGFVQDTSYTLGITFPEVTDEGFNNAYGSGEMTDPITVQFETAWLSDDDEEDAFVLVESWR